MRRGLRIVGTVLLAAGVGAVAWALTVWVWQDPFTALYTKIEQHRLARQYDRFAAGYDAPSLANAPLPDVRREITQEAREYRMTTHRGQPIGRIVIPRLHLHMVLVNGTDHDSLTKGPGRDLRTYMPGQGELIYIAGHRTTYLAPFAHIERLRDGDFVILEVPYATFRYRIFKHRIVEAHDLSVLRSHHRELVELQACHPRFFATQRYIAYGTLVRIEPRGGEAFAASASALAASGLPAQG